MLNKEINLIDIVKLQKWYMDIFEQEDSDYPDYRVIGQKNRHIQRILNKITSVDTFPALLISANNFASCIFPSK